MKRLLVVLVLLTVVLVGVFAADDYYMIIKKQDLGSLEDEINKYAERGWVVSGGITQAIDSFFIDDGKNKLYYIVLMYRPEMIATQ
ncbi:MAG: hypothetical protein ACOYJ1_11415 [Peptococcales bacterium]|jgi:hypothetical protein